MSETTRSFVRSGVETEGERVRAPGGLRARMRAYGWWLEAHPRRALLAGFGLALGLFAIGHFVQSRASAPMLLAAVEEGPFEV